MGLHLELQEFSYPGERSLFRSVVLEVSPGETVALVGGSGSGKTTLITTLAGLHPQPLGGRWKGSLQVEPVRERPSQSLGYLGSDPTSFLTGFCSSVLEEVGWSLFGWGWPADKVEARVRETLEELRLVELVDRNPLALSGGQQQMVALAAVWARRPDYLLFDEPAGKLDPLARRRLAEAVLRLAKERGAGVVWATQDLGEVTWCDTVWALRATEASSAVEVTPSPAGEMTPSPVVEVTQSPAAEVTQSPAGDWQPGDNAAVRPWPVQWAERWGTPVGSWQSRKFSGPLPEPVSVLVSPELAIDVAQLRYQPPEGEAPLFRDLGWQVRRGETVGLVGANGVGKTTLARLLKRLLRAQGGTTVLLGEPPPTTAAALASTVAYTFQDPENLFVRHRVDEELLYGGQLLGLAPAEAERRTELALQRFGLKEQAACHPRELPAAQASLLAVALSWYSQAPIQILDEPLARLDRPARERLEETLREWRQAGTTVILIAHDLDWLCTVCSKFSVLHEGAILTEGSAPEVFADPRVQSLLGAPFPLVESSR